MEHASQLSRTLALFKLLVVKAMIMKRLLHVRVLKLIISNNHHTLLNIVTSHDRYPLFLFLQTQEN